MRLELPALTAAEKAADKAGEAVLQAFLSWTSAQNISLYTAQENAIMELLAGHHVILKTPTGSGKSLVATAMQAHGLATGRRSYYTCPIKALVSEKFFALCETFGAAHVGMLTGESNLNPQAPIICCTAEILANKALREGRHSPLHDVIMDEFHYYDDAARGMAWQIPLLCLPQCQFLLMSATLGETTTIEKSLRQLTGKNVVVVQSYTRPVPLDFTYCETPLHETLASLLASHKTPIYVVNFSQRECLEQAQNCLSVDFCSKAAKTALASALANFCFDSPFGKEMRRFVSHGIGLHHAGLLPKYRLLVEKLAQAGLLKVIMGTDTLGVGVNVPIRSVVLSRLCKFDGTQTKLLSVREFQQIVGRAGRKGFDEQGSVLVQAPEHVIENKRLESRVGDDPRKKRKLVKKKAPTRNYVPWDATTLEKLRDAFPAPMQSRFEVTYAMLLSLLQQDTQGYRHLVQLIANCHDSAARQARHRRHAAMLCRALRQAQLVSLTRQAPRNGLSLNAALQDDFALHQSLTLYVVDTLPQLDPDSPTYALDILSLLEAILENPSVVLAKQVDKLWQQRLAELKAAGMDYEARQIELEKITPPQPNATFIYATFNHYVATHPWLQSSQQATPIRPKSIAREMYERYASFSEYVRDYALQRSEGVLLRYLSQVYKTLRQSIPTAYQPALVDCCLYLRTMLARVDASLVEAWENLLHPLEVDSLPTTPLPPRAAPDWRRSLAQEPRALLARVRHDMHRLLEALARQDYAEAAANLRQDSAQHTEPWTAARLASSMAAYFAAYGTLLCTPAARQPHHTLCKPQGELVWQVVQTLCDPPGEHFWSITAEVDLNTLEPSDSASQAPVLALLSIDS